MRTCIIFNPTAKGDRARHFLKQTDTLGREAVLKQTDSPSHAVLLAAEAVREGFEIVVAAGGDGTLNEVINGIASVPGGCEQTRLGVLPLGTINVFAREMRISRSLDRAWNIIRAGNSRAIDLGRVDFDGVEPAQTRFFAQLGGAGLDARAIENVSWKLKKKIGPAAYVYSGFRALGQATEQITVTVDGAQTTGELVLFGNGKRYGGEFKVFPDADISDGLLHVCVFPKMRTLDLLCSGARLLTFRPFAENSVRRFQTRTFKLAAAARVPIELDGEPAGALPVTISVEPKKLHVLVPAP